MSLVLFCPDTKSHADLGHSDTVVALETKRQYEKTTGRRWQLIDYKVFHEFYKMPALQSLRR